MTRRLSATAAAFSIVLAAGVMSIACDPVKMPYEMPGPVGCGMRDPRESGPSMLSVAQQTALRNQGPPLNVERNDKGGLTWVYVRQAGSVFGESETAEEMIFDAQGLLVEQKTEIR